MPDWLSTMTMGFPVSVIQAVENPVEVGRQLPLPRQISLAYLARHTPVDPISEPALPRWPSSSVSTRVNNPAHDIPECITALEG